MTKSEKAEKSGKMADLLKQKKTVTIIVIVILLLVCIPIACSSHFVQSKIHDNVYATGQTYQFTGTLETVSSRVTDDPSKNSESSSNAGLTHFYEVKIASDDQLPDGTYVYESDKEADYEKLSSRSTGPKYVFTVAEDGTIKETAPAS